MVLLAIESSCDETAAAVLGPGGEVLADVVHSQVEAHAPYGGVVPEIASREHLEKIDAVVGRALREAKQRPGDVSAVAATFGPGLVGALLVGLQYAKGFAQARGVPFVGVHHIEGHLMAVAGEERAPAPPFIALVVSGGHSAIYRYNGLGDVVTLGETRDDAAGEAFDKTAKLLGLGYPGGQKIDACAERGDPTAFKLPIALKARTTYDFSFSGLKTSVRLLIERLRKEGQAVEGQLLDDVCASLRAAIVDALLNKAILACRRTGVLRLVLGGGVAANTLLRREAERRCAENDVEVFIPPRRLCTDNAVMIARAGQAYLAKGRTSALDLNASPGASVQDATAAAPAS